MNAFAHPVALCLLPLAFLPVLIEYFVRPSAAKQDWNHLTLLQRALTLATKQRRRRRLFTVLAQTLAVLLLVLAAAGPRWHRGETPTAARTLHVVLLDETASMLYKPSEKLARSTRAKEFTLSLRKHVPTSDRVVQATSDGSLPQELLGTYEAVDYYLVTDRQETDWKELNARLTALKRLFPKHPASQTLVDLSGATANVAVTELLPKQNNLVLARIRNFSQQPWKGSLELVAHCTTGKDVVGSEKVTLPPEGTATLTFPILPSTDANYFVARLTPVDALAEDNIRYALAAKELAPQRVLLVLSEQPGLTEMQKKLTNLFAPWEQPEKNYEIAISRPQKLAQQDLGRFPLLLLTGPLQEEANLQQLSLYQQAGGSVLLFQAEGKTMTIPGTPVLELPPTHPLRRFTEMLFRENSYPKWLPKVSQEGLSRGVLFTTQLTDDLLRDPSFVAFLREAAAWAIGRKGSKCLTLGQNQRILLKGRKKTQITVIKPNGETERQEVLPETTPYLWQSAPVSQFGIYQAVLEEPVQARHSWAVNVAPQQSDLTPHAPANAKVWKTLRVGDAPITDSLKKEWRPDAVANRNVVRILILVALGLFVVAMLLTGTKKRSIL